MTPWKKAARSHWSAFFAKEASPMDNRRNEFPIVGGTSAPVAATSIARASPQATGNR